MIISPPVQISLVQPFQRACTRARLLRPKTGSPQSRIRQWQKLRGMWTWWVWLQTSLPAGSHHLDKVFAQWRSGRDGEMASVTSASNRHKQNVTQTKGREGDSHHVWQGYSLLGNDQSDIKGGFDGWFIPAGESSAGIGSLVWGEKTPLRSWVLHLATSHSLTSLTGFWLLCKTLNLTLSKNKNNKNECGSCIGD